VHKIFHVIIVLVITLAMTACSIEESAENNNTSASGTGSTSGSTESVNLSWTAPASRSDGDYLSPNELAGYKVYMGSSANNLTQLVDLNDNQATGFTVNNLESGSYYFAVSAYDQEGLESGFSQVIRIDVS
jgi:hypothetical protein